MVVGEHDDSEPDSDHPSRERYTVTEIFEHEDYVGVEDNYNNDIGETRTYFVSPIFTLVLLAT